MVVGAAGGRWLDVSDLRLWYEGIPGRRIGCEVGEPQGRSTVLVRGLSSHVAVVPELIRWGEWVGSRQNE